MSLRKSTDGTQNRRYNGYVISASMPMPVRTCRQQMLTSQSEQSKVEKGMCASVLSQRSVPGLHSAYMKHVVVDSKFQDQPYTILSANDVRAPRAPY